MAEDKQLITPQQKKDWFEGWSKMMVNIWRDRLHKHKVWCSGSLYASVSEQNLSMEGANADVVKIVHNFLQYGIYVDMGTGKEFGGERNEKGQLIKETTRKPKPWLSKAYYRSTMVAKDFAAEAYGDQFVAIMSTNIRAIAKAWREKS